MGFDKLTTPMAGIPLIRRVVAGLGALHPVLVGPPALANLVGDLPVTIVLTEPTPGPAATLRLADAAVARDRYLAVVLADLPWLDAEAVLQFIARVDPAADMSWPVVDGTPGHPVIWSPRARGRLGGTADAAPGVLRENAGLRTAALPSDDRRGIDDVDTPHAWRAAASRF
jgi:CTP:molybdopterin cytidylyltransferase MocA